MPYVPPTQPSIKTTKSFPYRGGSRVWSNRYFFTGANLTHAQFLALVTALTDDEKILFGSEVSITEAIRYDAGSDVPVESESLSIAGTLNETNTQAIPGESVILARFSTDRRTSKNHPIYLFKYWHGARKANGDPGDNLLTLQYNHAVDVATDMVAGYSDGSTTRHVCGPFGAVALGFVVSPYIHHRDFPT